jgi:hypothetical protein
MPSIATSGARSPIAASMTALQFGQRGRARRIGPGGRNCPWRQRERDPDTQRLPVGFWQTPGGAFHDGLRRRLMSDPFHGFDFAFEAIDLGPSTAGKFEAHKPEVVDYQKYRVESLKKQRNQR